MLECQPHGIHLALFWQTIMSTSTLVSASVLQDFYHKLSCADGKDRFYYTTDGEWFLKNTLQNGRRMFCGGPPPTETDRDFIDGCCFASIDELAAFLL